MRTLDDHRQQYEVGSARARLREEVIAERERVALRENRPEPPTKPNHVHRYSQFTFTCSCGKHGRAW